MKRRHVLAAPLAILAAPAQAALPQRRVLVVPSVCPLEHATITPSTKNPGRGKVQHGFFTEASRAALLEASRAVLDDPNTWLLTSIQVTCKIESIKARVVSIPGATEAELDWAHQLLERGEVPAWPHKDCKCGERHPMREPLLVIHNEYGWSAIGFSEADSRAVSQQLRMLREDADYKMFVSSQVILKAFHGRVISMPGATAQEVADAREALGRGESLEGRKGIVVC